MAGNQLQTTDGNQAIAALPPGTVTLPPVLHGMLEMPATKQMGLIFSLGAAIALLILVGVWAMTPPMTPLYSSLDGKDAADVSSALVAAGIEYELDTATGMVMVAKDKLHEARMQMAALGLPKKATMRGMEQLSEEQGFGTSQFIETARYHHALEAELARTISSLRNIRSARVHLALPKQSVFVRDRVAPSASVVVDIIGGQGINSNSVGSIVHLVSSSVPNMTANQVTVVDQNGRLLSDASDSENGIAMTAKQYQYARQLETDMVHRIESLLTPIIGVGKVRAQVNAEIDFDAIESTSENFDPQKRTVRSEQTSENRKASGLDAEGIPGALSNQPPENATLTENTDITNPDAQSAGVVNSSRNAVRNYELDRTISHTRRGVGAIKRLSVAVLVDHALLPEIATAPAGQAPAAGQPAAATTAAQKTGKLVRRALNEEEIKRLTQLVQEAIGYDQARGDTVNLISEAFIPDEEVTPVDIPFYEQGWFWTTLKQAGGVLLVLYILFGVLKPSLRNLSNYRPPVVINTPEGKNEEEGIRGEVVRNEQGEVIAEEEEAIPIPEDHDKKIEFAQAMVEHDARRVAKVVKEWVANG